MAALIPLDVPELLGLVPTTGLMEEEPPAAVIEAIEQGEADNIVDSDSGYQVDTL